MKKLTLLMVVGISIALVSCGPASWTDGAKKEFMDGCVSGLKELGDDYADKSKDYCKCALEKVMEKSDNPNNLTEEDGANAGLECASHLM